MDLTGRNAPCAWLPSGLSFALVSASAYPAEAARPRARELGIRLGLLPTGPHNAITDVPGVRVGHTTLIEGEGALVPGIGPVRTGVTAIIPHDADLFLEK